MENIANALLAAKEILTQMISMGLNKPEHLLIFANTLSNKYSLSIHQSITIIEEALKIC